MAKSASLRATMVANDEAAAAFGGSPQWVGTIDFMLGLGQGVALDQFDIAYMRERTVATGANDDIDLNGVLTDAFGATIAALKIVAIVIVNRPVDGSANTTNLTIGAGTNPWLGMLGGTTPTIGPIRPGGMFMAAAGHASGLGSVVAGTGDILRIANSSGAQAKYQIGILARTS